MRIQKKILYPCLGALCLSLIGVTALLSHSPKASEVQADHSHSTAGLYARVTDVSDIHDGDTVIMISDNGHAVRDIGGNPTFLYTRNDSIFVSQDHSLALLDNAYVVPFTVRQGYTAGTFAFYGDYNKNYTNMGGYVSYDRRGSNNDNPGPHDYSGNGAGIGYWYEGCGLRKNKDLKESSFTLTYNEEDGVGHMWIQNVYLKDNQVDGEWKAPNLVWTSSYSDRFGWGWGSNINIYKQLSVTSVSMVTPPDQTTFTVGDKLDLGAWSSTCIMAIISTPRSPMTLIPISSPTMNTSMVPARCRPASRSLTGAPMAPSTWGSPSIRPTATSTAPPPRSTMAAGNGY